MKIRSRHPRSKSIVKRVRVSFFLFLFSFSLFSTVSADEIKSRAAVVMDAVTGRVLYAKNPDLRLLPASTTKLMTALVVLEKANLNDVVTVSRKAANTTPVRSGLKEGDKVKIETLLYAALMKSANDAAVALAEATAGSEEEFVTLMNSKAIAIGANDTRYINANGLPGDGQYITAYDLAKIMRQAIKYPILKEILGTRITEISTETGKTLFIKNTNKLLWSDDELVEGKTGYTRQARHCFVCAGERDNETIIAALLGAPSREVLWKETEALMAFGSNVISNVKEPVVYLTMNDRSSFGASRVSYSADDKAFSHHLKIKKKVLRGKKYVRISSRKKGRGRAVLARNKSSRAALKLAKCRRVKKPNMAKRDDDQAHG
jgi:serine-type D-Ala-D-Ala carboxypeptidase (penicillin-binding protein 5/6)